MKYRLRVATATREKRLAEDAQLSDSFRQALDKGMKSPGYCRNSSQMKPELIKRCNVQPTKLRGTEILSTMKGDQMQ